MNPSHTAFKVAAVVIWPFRQAQGPELVDGLAGGVTTAATAEPERQLFRA